MTRSIGCVTGEIGTCKLTAIRSLKDQLDANKYRFKQIPIHVCVGRNLYFIRKFGFVFLVAL
ncbi:hypothetical protein RB620_20710 [Paenibacillus sp. LHD-117]|uniref:hypothetical protein n=1 Tax=Paenibacillus sp. LHD-117 TaxID=3071412 RepID=UPI0027E202EC|nr:hypothetical protein [Paenibacillus sp. LHD-117]MDQ6421854.1 hypothetical protein [Paenibacillus sp. LHD-117]